MFNKQKLTQEGNIMAKHAYVDSTTWNAWEQELADWPKQDLRERIGITKQRIYGLAARLQLQSSTIIRLHQADDNIHAEPYLTWYGQLKFRHSERITDVWAWCFKQGVFDFALLSDGDIAEKLLQVPVAHSQKVTSYYQAIDLSSEYLNISDLHIIQAGLNQFLTNLERINHQRPVSTR
jgi:hypothetical protein